MSYDMLVVGRTSGPTKEELLKLSTSLYEVAKDHIDPSDDNAILRVVREHLEDYVLTKIGRYTDVAIDWPHSLYHVLLSSKDGMIQIVGFVKWARAGFPQIQMGHKFAAALLVTGASEEALELVRPPFPAFVIEVPTDLLFIIEPRTKTPDPIRRIFVVEERHASFRKFPGEFGWAYFALSASGLLLYRYGVKACELLPSSVELIEMTEDRQKDDNGGPFEFQLTEMDERTSSLVGRLVVNTCLAMSDPTNVKERGPNHGRTNGGKNRTCDEPKLRVYELGKPITIDFRKEVQAYGRGERASPSVQVLVAGHYKMQPHGPKNTLRKLIWRAPFWRGPEAAPIHVRAHTLGKEGEGR